MRLDDGQRGERTAAEFIGHARAAFEQARMQIKHIARISFATGRPLQHERNLPISDGVLRQIIENDECVHAVVHEPLAHRRAGERREILIRRRIGCGGGDDCGIRHGSFSSENVESARDVGIFLTDCDINAVKRTIIFLLRVFGRLVQPRLTDDRVDRDGCFARGAVADNQLTLAATDRNHRVDRHNAGLHRLTDATPLDHARRNFFQWIKRFGFDRPLAIERLTNGVNDAAEKRFADWDLKELPRGPGFVAFGYLRIIAEQNRADFRFFQVQRDTKNAIREFDHLVEHDVA